jgi:ADP-dependent NAD(P)H-hydrate dehydratase / NAD(P)H-hydrate epimerase
LPVETLWRAEDVRELDRRMVEDIGLPGAALMEVAGAAAAAILRERYPNARRVAVVCGPGNNGGDGFVVARRLRDDGLDVWIVLAAPVERFRGDAATMFKVADKLGVPHRDDLAGADVVVDALLGTGSEGAPRGPIADAISRVAQHGAPVLALDVPSGVDSTTGAVPGVAIRAACTVSFHGRKLGTAIEPGRSHAGEVLTVPIGLPRALEPPSFARRIEASDLASIPSRDPAGTKYDAGAVLIVGGAPGTSGAPLLAARAALHSGAGVVFAAVAPEVRDQVAIGCPELMVHGTRDPDEVLALAARADAVVLGPGLGRDDGAMRLVDGLVAGVRGALVLDADALYALRGRLASLRDRPGPTALTPHAGELARLLEIERDAVSAARLESVQRAAAEAGCSVLLKGPDTLVATLGEPLIVVETAVPGLATAGAGDVLSGVVAALLARGLEPSEALSLAAAAHGEAAAHAAAQHGTFSASDLERPLGLLLAR